MNKLPNPDAVSNARNLAAMKRGGAQPGRQHAGYVPELAMWKVTAPPKPQNAPTAPAHTKPVIEAALNTRDCWRKRTLPDMSRKFKVLQANVRKMSEAQHSIMNDHDLEGFSLLLISEP
ncbi:hypothetical protein BKA66DRAFT_281695 [Pyrenochaeta sp. MPI-SDFR-AT-0127]|nr:hypothetical protein BKA66DRAFT_281695 [Pyrenochaeta sp. MPI-SDFR-AT-0127]